MASMATVMVCIVAFSSHPPDPNYFGAEYVRQIYRNYVLVGCFIGAFCYFVSLWSSASQIQARSIKYPQ